MDGPELCPDLQQEAKSKYLTLKKGQDPENFYLSWKQRITDGIQTFEIWELKPFSISHLHSPGSGEPQQVWPLGY